MPPSATHPRHDWLVRLCTWTAFVLSLGWGSTAFAAAPMCGSRAQTVVAPPIGTPASTDALTAVNPCQNSALLRFAGVPQRDAPEKLSLPELAVRAFPALTRVAECPVTARLLPRALREQDILATGFARSIDRPPRP